VTRTFATNAENQDTLPASARNPVLPRSVALIVDLVMVTTGNEAVATQMPDATDATRMVTLPETAKRHLRDATDAISQDTWPRTVKMTLKVGHATTVPRLDTCNVTAHRQPPRTATNARNLVTLPVIVPLRSVRIDRSPMTVMTVPATTVASLDTFQETVQSRDSIENALICATDVISQDICQETVTNRTNVRLRSAIIVTRLDILRPSARQLRHTKSPV